MQSTCRTQNFLKFTVDSMYSYHSPWEIKQQGILTNSLKTTDSIIPTFHQLNRCPSFTARDNAPLAPCVPELMWTKIVPASTQRLTSAPDFCGFWVLMAECRNVSYWSQCLVHKEIWGSYSPHSENGANQFIAVPLAALNIHCIAYVTSVSGVQTRALFAQIRTQYQNNPCGICGE